MDLIKLVEISKANPQRVTVEATVTTGFECVAISECRAKFLEITEICKARGRIYFNVDILQLKMVHSLRSVDNIFVVADAIPSIGFSSLSMEEDLETLRRHVSVPDWSKLLTVWQKDLEYKGICYPTCDQHLASSPIEIELKKQAKLIASKQECFPVDTNSNLADNEDETRPNIGEPPDVPSKSKRSKKSQRASDAENARLRALVLKAYNEIDSRAPGEKLLKFRVTCYRSGKHTFASQEAAYKFGGELQDKFNWIVELELFDLEIVVTIKFDQVYVSLALTKESKHKRNICHFGPTTLRATICYNLLHLGEPQVGDIIVDPMCGGGSIPIEGMLTWPGTFHIGADLHPKAVERSLANVQALADNTNYIDLASWDVTRIPLRDGCVDLFVIDLPFGRRSGNKRDNRVLYKEALLELARVVSTNGRAVMLTEDRRSFLKALPQMKELWILKRTLNVNQGGLQTAVYILKRNQ